MSTTAHDPCPRCEAPLPAYSIDAEHLTCAACGASLWRARPRAYHPLRRDGEVWSPPPTQTAPTPTEPAMQSAPVTHCELVIVDHGPHRLAVLKVVYELSGLGLAEAKRILESLPARYVVPRAKFTERVANLLRAEGCTFTIGAPSVAAPEPGLDRITS
jgi:Ribosomal protein L7/L12 C-terminal domain